MTSDFQKRTFIDDIRDPAIDAEFLNKIQDKIIELDEREVTATGGGSQAVARKIIPSGTTIINGLEIELPISYIVGNNSLSLFWNSGKLILVTNSDGHYTEVGAAGSISNKIKMYRTQEDGNYTLPNDVILEVVVLGGGADENT